jgi:hypothetical protein
MREKRSGLKHGARKANGNEARAEFIALLAGLLILGADPDINFSGGN